MPRNSAVKANQAVQETDGQWSVRGLLPLPKFGENSPVVKVQDATLIVGSNDSRAFAEQAIRGIELTLTPLGSPPPAAASNKRYRLEGAAKASAAGELRLAGEFGSADGYIQLTVTASGFDISSLATHFGVDLSGRADGTVHVCRPAAYVPLVWSADVTIQGGRLAHPMLPLPLTGIACVARAEPNRLIIQQLTGTYGHASVAVAAERAGWSANAPLSLAAKFVGLRVDERLAETLPQECARVWQRFQPTGIVDSELQLKFDGQNWQPHLTADCHGISLTDAQKFPYLLEQTTGRVEYKPAGSGRPDQLQLNLTGVACGRPVRIEAKLTHVAPGQTDVVTSVMTPNSTSPRHPVGLVEISGADIPFHEQLIAALPPNGEALARSLQPNGVIDFGFRAEWKTLSQPRANVTQEIRLKDCAIQFARFPFPLRNVQGMITANDWQWKVHDIVARGTSDYTAVKCTGDVLPQANSWHADLSIEATNVPLDDNLRLALPPAAQRAWLELRPQGQVDFNAHVVHDPAQGKPVVEVALAPRNRSVSIEMARFPYRLDQIEGVATYRPGRVDLRNIVARHDRTVYSASAGAWQLIPDGGWQFSLSGFNADRLTPHRTLVVALPPRLRQAFERLQPDGTFGVYNSALSFAKPPAGQQLAAAWDINLDCHQASIQGVTPIRTITGGIRLVGRDDGQAVCSAGELALDSLVVKDIQLTNIRGPLWVDSAYCLLGDAAAQRQGQPPRRITADVYGGSLAANVDIQHAENAAYKIDLALGGASLARFANERLGGPEDMNGIVSGRLLLAGAGRAKDSLRGSGELHVVDANIYKLPVLVAMLKVLRNRPPDTTAFNRCDMQFTIHGQDIHFQQLNLLGDAVNFYGKGDSNFNRQVDLVFYTLIEPAMPIPLLRTVATQLSQQAWQLKVVGTWDKVEVQHQTLPGVNQMWEQLQAEIQDNAPRAAGFIPAGGSPGARQ